MKFSIICLWFLLLLSGRDAFSQDVPLIDSLEKRLSDATTDSARAQVYFKLTWNNLLYNLEKSRYYAAKSLETTKKMKDSLGIYRVYHYWGLIHRLESNYDSALYYFRRVVNFHNRQGREERSLQALFNMGVIYSFQGLYPQSLEHYRSALKIADEVEDQFMKADILNSMGLIHKRLKNYSHSLQMTFSSLKAFETLAQPIQQANCLSNIGSIFMEMKELDSALLYYQKAYALDTAENLNWGIGHQLNNIGHVYLEKGNYLLAQQYLQKSLSVREQLGQKKEIAESLERIAYLYTVMHKNNLSIEFGQKAMYIAIEIGDRQILRDTYRTLTKAYENFGDFKNAYQKHVAYTTLSDSILNEENIKYIHALEAQYESEKKEKEIALLNQEKAAQTAAINRKNTFLYTLIVVFTLSLLLILVNVLFFRARVKAKELIAAKNEEINRRQIQHLKQQQKIISMDAMVVGQEKERRRIAKDLHDGLGNLLANVQMQFSMVQELLIAPEKTAFYHEANDMLMEACREVRKIAHNMMPGALTKFGLVPAIQDMCYQIEKTLQLKVDVQVYGISKRFEEKIEIHVYRIIQELFNNIVKHAQASEVIIQIAKQGDELNLLVEDDGKGFDLQAAKAKGGLGIRSLESRVQYLDGMLEIDSSPGHGSSIIITIPVRKREKAAT